MKKYISVVAFIALSDAERNDIAKSYALDPAAYKSLEDLVDALNEKIFTINEEAATTTALENEQLIDELTKENTLLTEGEVQLKADLESALQKLKDKSVLETRSGVIVTADGKYEIIGGVRIKDEDGKFVDKSALEIAKDKDLIQKLLSQKSGVIRIKKEAE